MARELPMRVEMFTGNLSPLSRISLECRYSLLPGSDWFCNLEFRKAEGGTAVVFRTGGSDIITNVTEYEYAEELNWRSVVNFLLDNVDVCIFGEYGDYQGCIKSDGIDEWMKVPICLAWIKEPAFFSPRYKAELLRILNSNDENAENLSAFISEEILRLEDN
jgi:hypothetical protein